MSRTGFERGLLLKTIVHDLASAMRSAGEGPDSAGMSLYPRLTPYLRLTSALAMPKHVRYGVNVMSRLRDLLFAHMLSTYTAMVIFALIQFAFNREEVAGDFGYVLVAICAPFSVPGMICVLAFAVVVNKDTVYPLVLVASVYSSLFLVYFKLLRRRSKIIVKRKRRLSGFCIVCGYDLHGITPRCPECGTLADDA